MRICFVCNEYPPAPHGGIGIFVRNLARQLTRLGVRIAVVGFDSGLKNTGWSREGEVRILRLPRPRSARWNRRFGRYQIGPGILTERIMLSKAAAAAAREFRADIVESYDWSGPLWRAPLRPLVVRLHGAHTAYQWYEGRRESRLLRLIERRNVLMADALAAVSAHIGAATLQALGLGRLTFRVLYNGVDTELFGPVPVEPDCREVLYVGSVTRRKGVPDLLAAVPLVLKEVPDAGFTIAGPVRPASGGTDPVETLLAPLPRNLRDRVRFIGPVAHTDLPAHYCRAAVAVFPSRAEAFGLTCAEAMACGAAVVMTSLGSGPELVEDENSGLLADPRNPQELAAAIVRLLREPELRKHLGEAARRCALEKFNIRSLANRNLNFYQEVLLGSSRR